MRCTSPRTVGFQADGKTISWSPKNISKEYATFQLPCGKCIECRLDYARQWAIRCVHESQMHTKNAFITLTYSDNNLKSDRLQYEDFQKFMKKLRKLQNQPIGYFVTGEYGELTKRPHWHAIIFNWEPNDGVYKYSNSRGDKVYESKTLTDLWANGIAEYGSVTFESAGYCARYAAKKLVHGKDEEHDYKPISKKSSKHAIGKRWLEQYWPDAFNFGRIVLPNGKTCGIPRYYEKWLKKNHPDSWNAYVTKVKRDRIEQAERSVQKETLEYHLNIAHRNQNGIRSNPLTKNQVKSKIIKEKFKMLQNNLKLK